MARTKSLAGGLHAHGCDRCQRRVEDDCKTPTVDPLCYSCRTGKPPAVWDANRLPQECCYANCRPCTPVDRAVYRLAGTRNWHLCRTCKRTHPVAPVRTTVHG